MNHNVNSNYEALILSVGNLAGFQKLDRASCSSNTFCEGGRQDLFGLLTTVETNNTEKDSRRKVGLKTISSKLLEAVRSAFALFQFLSLFWYFPFLFCWCIKIYIMRYLQIYSCWEFPYSVSLWKSSDSFHGKITCINRSNSILSCFSAGLVQY